MKNFKKFLTLVLAVMMVVSSVAFSTSAATTKFEDVDADNETLVKAVDLLAYMGVAKGTSETTFGSDELVTREQFALFIYRLMKGGKDAPKGASNSTKFTDLEDSTYFYAISWANANGIVNGKSATTFGPKDPIKLKEAYAMIVRALDWEEENDLVYPYGHIEIAEQDGVELDNGLDSSVGYEDELTRGDMAILLYNAFFAETGVEEVVTKEKELGEDSDHPTWVLYEYTTNPRLCEKAFDVIEVEYQATATPHYTLGEVEATYDFGYDAIYFEKTDSEVNDLATDVDDQAYVSAEDLGLGEDLDQYFLGHFTLFVTAEDDGEIEKVLFADCNMTKKTVTDLKFAEVSTNKAVSYFDESEGEAKLLSGKIMAGAEEIYAYNAPYSYATPSYDVTDVLGKYKARNEENIETLSFDMKTEDEEKIYTATTAAMVEYPSDEAIEEGRFQDEALSLIENYAQIYYGGLYEADLYDVDGDGIYDYINYKPYEFFQVDNDEDEYFEYSDFEGADNAGIPYIYTNEATVIGEKFAAEDYVIGYYDADLEIVKVAAVVEPTVASVVGRKISAGTVTLSTEETVDAVSAWKLLKNFVPETIVWNEDEKKNEIIDESQNNGGLFSREALGGEELELYIYNGVVLMSEDVDANVKFSENLIIPTDIKAPRSTFNSATGEDTWYVYAWINGDTKYVPVATEDALPEVITADEELAAEYANQLCSYTVDEDGLYTIKSLGYDVDDDDEDYEGIEKEDITVLDDEKKEDKQFIVLGDTGSIAKIAGSRFTVGSFERTLDFKSYTKIIIRVYDEEEDEYEYVEYDASSFKKSLDGDLENMTYIVSNNADSKSRENLVLLYAETTDLEFKGTKDKNGYRIVSNYDVGQDEEGEWRNYYELYNPYTGEKATWVPSKDSASKADKLVAGLEEGTMINLVEGMVDEEEIVVNSSDAEVVVDTAAGTNLVWISEVDTTDGYMAVVPYSADVEGKDAVEAYVEDNADATVYDIYGDEIPSNFIDFDKNTVVTVMNYANTSSMWNWGTMSASTINALAAAKNDVLCYNDKAEDRNGNYKTEYAEYVKAYVSVDTNVDLEDGENPVAEFIIIIVNADEKAALND